MIFLLLSLAGLALLALYIWHLNHGMTGTPPEALALAPKRWTKRDIREAYEKVQDSPTDVKPYLFSKKARRYIVVGGSGLVGGWIVKHLVMRGEDPAAICILDLRPPTMAAVLKHNINFIKTDVTDPSSLSKAFNTPWPNPKISNLPLTIFHCVAYIKPSERKADFLSTYLAVNVNGTANVVNAAKSARGSILIATSSGSIGSKSPHFFLPPWSRWPRDFYQVLVNADPPEGLDASLESFGSCYAYSKARAEKIVREADDPKGGFRTGCIRPAHAIYGAGMENENSITWSYLSRGGAPSWLHETVTNFVDAQNVSVAHLAFEDRLLHLSPTSSSDPGGQAYCCTDPSGPVTYGDLYNVLSTLAHPSSPTRFPPVPPAPMLVIGYVIEWYALLRMRVKWLSGWLPELKGDVALLTPAMFNMSTLHLVYDDGRARGEIGYRAPVGTLEGLCTQVLEWNRAVERKAREMGKGSVEGRGLANVVHATPFKGGV